jgi:hypothetical protein
VGQRKVTTAVREEPTPPASRHRSGWRRCCQLLNY